MTDINNRLSMGYIKSVKKKLPIPGKMAKKLLGDLGNSVDEYIQSNPSVSMDEIVKRFGEPESIANEYISALDQEKLKEEIKKSRFIKRAVLIVSAVLITAIIVTFAIIISQSESDAPYYVYESIDE